MKFLDKWQENWTALFGSAGEAQMAMALATRAALALVGALVFWVAFLWIFRRVAKRAHKYPLLEQHPKFLQSVRKALKLLLILGCGMYLIEIFGLEAVENPFYAVMILWFAGPVKDLGKVAVAILQSNVTTKTETHVDDIVFDILNRFFGAIVYLAAAALALDRVGINVTPLIAGAGVVGIAVGFAAKDTLSNLIAGVLLLVDRPFEEGDRIEVWSAPAGSATWGDVQSIGLRATKIKTTDNITIVIPNNEIMTRDIINYTADEGEIRVRVNIGVAYDADIAQAKKIILGVADRAEWIKKDPAPKVVVRNFGESSVDLQARVWIYDATQRMNTISYLTDTVKMEFDRQGVEIPFPRRDIVIRGMEGQAPLLGGGPVTDAPGKREE